MVDQNLNIHKEQSSEWKEKKEVMERLAKALQTTSLPTINKNSPPMALSPKRCQWFIKLKTMLWRANKNH